MELDEEEDEEFFMSEFLAWVATSRSARADRMLSLPANMSLTLQYDLGSG